MCPYFIDQIDTMIHCLNQSQIVSKFQNRPSGMWVVHSLKSVSDSPGYHLELFLLAPTLLSLHNVLCSSHCHSGLTAETKTCACFLRRFTKLVNYLLVITFWSFQLFPFLFYWILSRCRQTLVVGRNLSLILMSSSPLPISSVSWQFVSTDTSSTHSKMAWDGRTRTKQWLLKKIQMPSTTGREEINFMRSWWC